MNKLNDEEHRRSEFSNTVVKDVRTAKTTVEEKFEKDGKPVEPAKASDKRKGSPAKDQHRG